MIIPLRTAEGEHRSTFVPMEIKGSVTPTNGATVLVSTHTRLEGVNPAGPCDSATGRVTFEQRGNKDINGESTPNIIPVVVCSRTNCDAKAFPQT